MLFSSIFSSFLFGFLQLFWNVFPHISSFRCVLISICVSALNDQKNKLFKQLCVCAQCVSRTYELSTTTNTKQNNNNCMLYKEILKLNLTSLFDVVVMCRRDPPPRIQPIPCLSHHIRKPDLSVY